MSKTSLGQSKANNTSCSESWIEIASRPSSPPLLTINTTDTSSHAQPNPRRRRRTDLVLNLNSRRRSVDCSSQEEYEESESESDRVMTSSNECLQAAQIASQIAHPPINTTPEQLLAEQEEIDESATAVGTGSNMQCFTPQPNAFSHPPSSHSRSQEPVPGSYFPPARPTPRPVPSRHSYPEPQPRQKRTHSPYNVISPLHQTDHDAALRASLSTLLSCAAAARGLPKSSQSSSAPRPPASSSRVDPATLRIIPEAHVLGGRQGSTSRTHSLSASSSRESLTAIATHDKGKRKAVRSSSKDRRASKKSRNAVVEEPISPTLLTWVTAAGVVVLVSALSFSTGYVIGRETGRIEGRSGMESVTTGLDCGKEAAKGGLGLKRLRWGSASSIVQA